MGIAMHPRKHASRLGSILLALPLILGIIIILEAQDNALRPSKDACPVTANLFPEQRRRTDFTRFIFPDGAIPRRVSIALANPEKKDFPIEFRWTGEERWGVLTGFLMVNGEGRTDCFSLENTGIPANVACKEFILFIPESIPVTEIYFSSLPSERPQELCPMPELEPEINEAYKAWEAEPKEVSRSSRLTHLLERITPKYDCRRSFDSEPVPAWWLADHESPWRWIDFLHNRILDNDPEALRVYVKFYDNSSGAFAEVMSENLWAIFKDRPLLILENWSMIKDDPEWPLMYRPWPPSGNISINEMIEIYQDIAVKEAEYRAKCWEIIFILTELKQFGDYRILIEDIQGRSAEIDQYVKDNQDSSQKLIARMNPLDHSSPGDSWEWKRIENWDEANDYFKGYWSFLEVAVWTKDSKVAFVETDESSDSGDWAINIQYYFDDRERLLQISTDFRTHIDKMKTLDFQYFDESGQMLGHTVDYYALGDKTSQKLSVDPETLEQPIHEIPVYLNASELPFYGLIQLDRKPIGPSSSQMQVLPRQRLPTSPLRSASVTDHASH